MRRPRVVLLCADEPAAHSHGIALISPNPAEHDLLRALRRVEVIPPAAVCDRNGKRPGALADDETRPPVGNRVQLMFAIEMFQERRPLVPIGHRIAGRKKFARLPSEDLLQTSLVSL